MKINFIGIGLIKSGGTRVIFEYSNRLQDLGHDVIFYFPIVPYKFKDEKFSYLVKKYYWTAKDVIFNKEKIFKNFYEHKFEVKPVNNINDFFIRDADVSIATTWPTAYSVQKLSSKKGKKIHYIQDYEVWFSNKDKVDNSFLLDLKKITISEYNKKLFLEKFGVESKVITLGVYDIYNSVKKQTNMVKTVSFIDHPLSSKGVENAVEVAKRLKNKYRDIKFISFGHERYHNMPDFVKFYKNPDDKFVTEEIYGKTDIFIYPSIYEGFGMPPAEAMACKCAVVTTTVGAVPEYSKHMETAIHVEPGNVDELYKGVCYLLDNEKEIIRISENSYRDIRLKLDWNESVKKFEDFISGVNGQKV